MKAVVLLNMGGARAKEELELFLRNMFNDKYILTLKSDFFRSILASFIVNSRKNSAWKNYEAIGGKSPIYDYTQLLIDKLQNHLGEDYFVTYCMRYTPPFANEVISNIKSKNIKEIVLVPLYPQYSTTTTKSSLEDILGVMKDDFLVKTVQPYFKNRDFNQIIIEDIIKTLDGDEPKDFNLIFSAHGLPQKVIDRGDPYQQQLQEQVEYIKSMLNFSRINFQNVSLAYQSKVGPMKWLEPSLEDELEFYKDKKVIIYPIAFTIDNSETTFELHIEYKEVADELKIKEYRVCQCMNDNDDFVEFLSDQIKH